MKINIRGSKIEITEAIENYIKEKIGRLERYIDFSNAEAIVVVKLDGIYQKVEVTIPLKNMILRAEVKEKDLYSSIDKITDKMERQIRKNKTKMKRKNTEKIVADFNLDFESDTDEDTKIVKRKTIALKPMNEEEAMLQMDLIDHDFFIFNNIETGELNVLYRRKDGNFGIIEAE